MIMQNTLFDQTKEQKKHYFLKRVPLQLNLLIALKSYTEEASPIEVTESKHGPNYEYYPAIWAQKMLADRRCFI